MPITDESSAFRSASGKAEDFADGERTNHRQAGACRCHPKLRYYQNLAREIVSRHVAAVRPEYEDRNVLEQIIIPFVLSRFEPARVLDVGREPYEAFYNEFFEGRELWTLDRDPDRRAFGAANHIVDDAARLADHFPADYFGFVLFNGVFGWGLDDPDSIESAFAAVHAILSPRGIFVLGWNDTPDLVPVPLDHVQSLKDFTPYYFEPLGGTSFMCATFRHTYNFFVK
jgi:SAM-dependent methyltransferase